MHARPLRDCVTASRTTRGWSSASAPCTAPGTRSSPAPRARPTTRRPGCGPSGTFDTAQKRLPAIADMGFDVVYLTPDPPHRPSQPQGPQQHPRRPASTTPARPTPSARPRAATTRSTPTSGRSTTSTAFVAEAQRLGLEVALDLALQASPDHPWVTTAPRAVHDPRRRLDRLRREPAEEVPGHLPAQLRQRPRGRLRRGAPGRAGVDRPRGQDLPRRQPAHQAGGVLAVADRRRRRRPPRGDLAGRGVHPARDDAHARQGRLPAVLHVLRLAQRRSGSSRSTSRSSPARPATYMRPSFWPTTHDILTPYMQYGGPTAWKLRAALAATLVADLRHLRRLRAGRARRRGPASRSRSTTRSTSTRTGAGPTTRPGGPKEGQSLAPYLTQLNQIRAAHPALHWLRNIALPPRRRRERHGVLQAAAGRRRATTSSSSWPTSTRTRPARRGYTSTCRRSAWLPGPLRGARADHRPDVALGRAQLRAPRTRRRTRARDPREEALMQGLNLSQPGLKHDPQWFRTRCSTRCSSGPSPTPRAPAPATSPA